MKRKITWFLFFFIAVSFSFAQTSETVSAKKVDLNEKLPIDNKVKIGKLDNGLVYYIRENKKPEQRIQFQLAVNAGSILESENQLGLAHFVEHMAFNGTKYYKGNQMIDELEKKGIVFGREINAYTGFDQTVYYVTIPSDNEELVDMGMKILDGWAFGLLLESSEIEKERGVILEEWRTGLGAADRIQKATWPIMFKGSLYTKRMPIGTEEMLRTFKHDSLRQFYSDWYHSNNMALMIVGDFKAADMEKRIKEYFSGYQAKENARVRESYTIPENKEPLIAIVTDPEATSINFRFFWKQPKVSMTTVEDFRKKLAIGMMDEMLSHRIYEKSNKADCPFLYAGVGFVPNFLPPVLDVYMGYCVPKDNQIALAFENVLAEIYRADRHGFLPTEFERSKESMLEGYEKAAKEESKTETGSFAAKYAEHYLFGSPIMSAKQELKYVKEVIDQISLEEINTFISQFITDENFVFTLEAPQEDGLDIPSEKDVMAMITHVRNMILEPYVDTYKEEPLFSETLQEGNIIKTVENTELGFTEYTLSNGVRFILKPTEFKNDEILIQAYSPGGTSIYPDSMYFTASLASSVIDMGGLAHFSASELVKKLNGKNCNISPSIDELTEGVKGYSSPRDLETALQMNYLYFTAPQKDQDAFEKLMSSIRTQIKFIRSAPATAFQEAILETCYPQNKRKTLIPTEEILNAVSLDNVFSVYQDRFADASDFTYFFVGNFGIDTTAPLIAKYLGNLPAFPRNETWIDHNTPFAKGKIEKVVEKGSEKQGMLAILSEVSYDWNGKDNLATDMLSQCLSITMTEVIREKMGGTYSPSVDLVREKYPTPSLNFVFAIGCDPDKANTLAKAALGIVTQYQKKGGDVKTLEKVKEQMKRGRERQLKENSFWMNILYNSYYLGTDINNLSSFNERVDAITLDDIKNMAKKYLSTKEYVKIALRNEPAKK